MKLQNIFLVASGFFLAANFYTFSQNEKNISPANYITIYQSDSEEQILEKAANVIPSKRQYEWQKLEITGFIHFGINTFNEVEWGQSTTDITKFNPSQLNTKQWVTAFKNAGIKLIVLTTKHHDGFCLWQSKFTDYSIAHTPYKNGKGDIVKELSDACREAGIKFGVYLSPWDMHEKSYGTPQYNIHFMNQLTELLTNYGKIYEVWFDGACGEGPNGKKQIYGWQSYYKLIRKLQPDAVIAVSGPDVRWVGTESGYGRLTEWSVLPAASTNQEEIAENSQQHLLDGAFIPHDLMEEDLGSRIKIKTAAALVWYPAEIDVSIRPRWFYHNGDNDLVKSPSELVNIYYNSVGLNGVLLLNVPPDKRGLISENDIKSLTGMNYILAETFKKNFVENCKAFATNEKKGNEAKLVLDDKYETFWTTEGRINTASLEIELNKEETFNRAMLQENIFIGQRVEKFHLEYWSGMNWQKFAEGTTIGYKRLLRFPAITSNKIKIVIDECRSNPTISSFGLYLAPPEISFDPVGGSFADSMHVQISSDLKHAKIFYTTDGTLPDEHSSFYSGKISVNKLTTVTALAISEDGKRSLPVKAVFSKAKYGIEYKSRFEEKYSGGGLHALVDGVTGSKNYKDGRWQGFNGSNLDILIDLKGEKIVKNISARFLRDINSYIFLPESVEYSISRDGKKFSTPIVIANDIPQNDYAALIKKFEFSPKNFSGRYIHIKAKNISVCPQWHKGAGEKAWIFTDEILIKSK